MRTELALPARVLVHVARATEAGLQHDTETAGGGYLVRLYRPRVQPPVTAADEFTNAESLCIIGDWRQIRRVEWRTLAGIKPIRVGDIGSAIAAVAL